jgi:hypothetical protein
MRAKRIAQVPKSAGLAHSSAVLLEMIGLADAGRCMACGWPLASSAERGCATGNCSFRPQREEEPYLRWRERTGILVLARKLLAGK